jgi:outer membrane lipopolysaccharide assembly protein LptE/RlpB
MKTHLTLLLIAGTALTLGACTHDNKSALDMPPGKYERTTSSTDANGTTTQNQTSTDVNVDQYGNKRAVVETQTTQDPKGLFNKTTTNKSKVVEQNY